MRGWSSCRGSLLTIQRRDTEAHRRGASGGYGLWQAWQAVRLSKQPRQPRPTPHPAERQLNDILGNRVSGEVRLKFGIRPEALKQVARAMHWYDRQGRPDVEKVIEELREPGTHFNEVTWVCPKFRKYLDDLEKRYRALQLKIVARHGQPTLPAWTGPREDVAEDDPRNRPASFITDGHNLQAWDSRPRREWRP